MSGWERKKPQDRDLGQPLAVPECQSDGASLSALYNSPQPIIVLNIIALNH